MKSVNILLPDVAAVKLFVNIIEQCDFDADLVSGRYRINAKSMMGIFSLDLSKPLDLYIHSDADAPAIVDALAPYIVKN